MLNSPWPVGSRDFIKGVATLAKIQRPRETSHHVTLTEKCQTFYSRVFVLCKGLLDFYCDLIPKCKGSALLPSLMEL